MISFVVYSRLNIFAIDFYCFFIGKVVRMSTAEMLDIKYESVAVSGFVSKENGFADTSILSRLFLSVNQILTFLKTYTHVYLKCVNLSREVMTRLPQLQMIFLLPKNVSSIQKQCTGTQHKGASILYLIVISRQTFPFSGLIDVLEIVESSSVDSLEVFFCPLQIQYHIL